jgi:hypothetical protein
LDNIYDVTIVNQGKTTLPREPITVGGHGTYVDYEPVLEAGEEVKTAFYLQDAAFLPPGLHRLTLYCTNCSTDIWVISFGDHMIAYK